MDLPSGIQGVLRINRVSIIQQALVLVFEVRNQFFEVRGKCLSHASLQQIGERASEVKGVE